MSKVLDDQAVLVSLISPTTVGKGTYHAARMGTVLAMPTRIHKMTAHLLDFPSDLGRKGAATFQHLTSLIR